MAIDPRIALGIQPIQLESPVNQLAQVLSVQNAQRQNELGSLQLQQARDERASVNALNDLYRSSVGADGKLDRNALMTGAASRGLGAKIPALQKQFADADKAEVDLSNARLTGQKEQQAIAEKGFNAYRQAFGALRGRPDLSPQLVTDTVGGLVAAGVLQPQFAQAMLSKLPQDQTGLAAAVEAAARAQLTPEQQYTVFAAKPEKIDSGAAISFRDTNPNSPTFGQTVGGAPVQKQVTPDARLSADTSIENNKRSVDASLANASATREVAKATRDAAKISADAKSETEIRKEFADLPEVKKYKNAIPAYKSVVEASKVNNPQADINLIYGLAKLYDPDSVVREGEYDTIARSQAIPEWLKGQAQRLVGGGKLTDATKKQIIEQANIRLNSYKGEYDASNAAFETIVKGRGLNPSNVLTPVGSTVAPTPSVPTSGQIPRITDDAGFNALPSGATFIGPDGKTRRKP